MHIDSVILQHLFNAVPHGFKIHYRRAFGCTCLYSGHTSFGFISKSRLYLHAPTDNRDYFAEKGLMPMRPLIAPTLSPSYFRIPSNDLRDPEKLLEWFLLALGNRAVKPIALPVYSDVYQLNARS